MLWHFSSGDKIENCSAQFLAVCWIAHVEFKVDRLRDGFSVSNALLLVARRRERGQRLGQLIAQEVPSSPAQLQRKLLPSLLAPLVNSIRWNANDADSRDFDASRIWKLTVGHDANADCVEIE